MLLTWVAMASGSTNKVLVLDSRMPIDMIMS